MRRRRGSSAAEVLVTIVVALVLAALVNADTLVRRAERKELGSPERARSLAIWHPVQDVSHIVQLYRIRQLADWVTGNDTGPAPSSPTVPPPTGPIATTTTLPPRPELREPTVAAPWRIWIGGDSVVRDASESLLRLAADDPTLSAVNHYVISSGLTRPDFFDWPAALATDMAATDPEAVFVMFGANDAQGIVAPDGTVFQQVSDPGWQAEYRRRVDAVMDQLREDGRLVYWIGQPPIREPGYSSRMALLDSIYEEAAASRPWIVYVDTQQLFGDGNGGYGDPSLRQDDGEHLSREGADLLAQHLLDLLDEERPVPATTVPPPTTVPAGVTVATEG